MSAAYFRNICARRAAWSLHCGGIVHAESEHLRRPCWRVPRRRRSPRTCAGRAPRPGSGRRPYRHTAGCSWHAHSSQPTALKAQRSTAGMIEFQRRIVVLCVCESSTAGPREHPRRTPRPRPARGRPGGAPGGHRKLDRELDSTIQNREQKVNGQLCGCVQWCDQTHAKPPN